MTAVSAPPSADPVHSHGILCNLCAGVFRSAGARRLARGGVRGAWLKAPGRRTRSHREGASRARRERATVVPPPLDAPMLLQIHGGVRALETIHTPCAGNSKAPPAGGPTHACTQCIALRHWPTAGPNGCWGLRYSTAIPGAHPLPASRSQGIWIVSMRGYIQRLAQRLGPTVPTAWLRT